MKKKHKNSKLEQSITDYFAQAELQADDEVQIADPAPFAQEKVYENILNIITLKQKKPSFIQVLKIAASVLLLLSASFALYHYRQSFVGVSTSELAMHETVAAKGLVAKVILSDGTTVFLNGGSKLIYPKSFDSSPDRSVTLQGEGYFQVVHDPKKPFLIHTEKMNTQVFGTSFNISAYTDRRDIEVTVLTGKVGVFLEEGDENARFLTSGYKVIYNKTTNQLGRPLPAENAGDLIAWSRGQMIYKNRPLIEVITEVERLYNIKIKISAKLEPCRITASLERSTKAKILTILAELIDGTLEYKNGVYLLTGKGC